MRYGDDFLLFGSSKERTVAHQQQCTTWLSNNLKLSIHERNNHVLAVKDSLHFLGHYVYANGEVHVDRHMMRKMQRKIGYHNVSTYKSMHITEAERKVLSWRLADKS